MTLVDTNVLLDMVTDDPVWAGWSMQQLDRVSLAGPLLINDVIYAELSIRFNRKEDLDQVVEESGLTIATLPRAALFLAGKAFQRYRGAGGSRSGVLPDFFIGAHAATLGVPLLTRDKHRYATYFPTLQLICPG